MFGELVATLLGLTLERIPAELQLHSLFQDERRSLRQMIEQRRPRADERRKRLHAVGVPTTAQTVQEHAPWRGVVAVIQIVPAVRAEIRRRLRRALERELASRKDHDLGHSVERALRRGIETSQRLDLVSGQLDAHRGLVGDREDVEDPAASRERPGLGDLRDRLVADNEQPFGHLVPGQPIGGVERARTRAQIFRRQRVLQQRAKRDHDRHRLRPLRQRP